MDKLLLAKRLVALASDLLSPPVIEMTPEEFQNLHTGMDKNAADKVEDVVEIETSYTPTEREGGYTSWQGGHTLEDWTPAVVIRVPGTPESLGELVELFQSDTFGFAKYARDGDEKFDFDGTLKDVKVSKPGFVDFMFEINNRL